MWKSVKNGLISRQAKIKKPDRRKIFEVAAGYYEKILLWPSTNESIISDFNFDRIHPDGRKRS